MDNTLGGSLENTESKIKPNEFQSFPPNFAISSKL